MSACKRAMFYLRRQKLRTSLLTIILTLMLILSLVGFSILRATGNVIRQTRRDIGGVIDVQTNGEADGELISADFAEHVSEMQGVSSVNAKSMLRMVFPQLQLMGASESSQVAQQLAPLQGNTCSDQNEYFLYGIFAIARGRALTQEDRGKVLISESVAFQSDLDVGDTIRAHWRSGYDTYDERGYPLTIAGVYRVQRDIAVNAGEQTWETPANAIFIDNETIQKIRLDYDDVDANAPIRFNRGMTVFLHDPLQLSQMQEQIAALAQQRYLVRVDDSVYQAYAAPLERLETIVRMLVSVVLTACAAILLLMIALWVRHRVYEIGVYLAIGFKKGEIVSQLLIECLIVAILAIAIACPISIALSDTVADSLYETIQKTQSNEMQENVVVSQEMEDVDFHVTIQELLATIGIDIFVMLLAAAVSAGGVLRLRPKAILSMMS